MLAAAPGERLRTLRDLLGLTQAELADASGVAQSWISQVETATREATEDGLRAIARATDTPLGFFSVQPKVVPLDSLRFRKNLTASKTRTKRVHAFYSESYRVAETILGERNYPPPPLPYATSEQLGQEDIEQFAADTREALRLAPDKPIPHLTRALERAGIPAAPMVLADEVDQPPAKGGHFGVSYWGGLGEPALIGYFRGTHGDRERFTLAHELGHLVLHTFRPRAADPEGEANRFASALLVPLARAQEDISEGTGLTDYARLKATWGVSMQALMMRASALDLIGDARKRSLFVQLSSKGWRKDEPVHVGHESPILLWSLLSRRFGQRPYRPAAEALSIHATVLRSIAPTPTETSGGGDTLATVRGITSRTLTSVHDDENDPPDAVQR